MARVRLFSRVGPKVLLQLGGVSEALSAFDAHVWEVLAVDGQQMAVEEPLLGCLVVAVFALVQSGLRVPKDEFVGAERAGLAVAPRVLCELVRLFRFAGQLVALQVVVETDFLVGGEIAVRTLVLLLYKVVGVILHVPFEEPPGFKLLTTDVTRVHGQRLTVGADDDSCVKRREDKNVTKVKK